MFKSRIVSGVSSIPLKPKNGCWYVPFNIMDVAARLTMLDGIAKLKPMAVLKG